MILGTAVPAPSALADAMALMRVIADPKAAKASLDAMAALGEQLTTTAAELTEREQKIAAETAANVEALAKIAAEQKKLDDARGTNARSLELVREARGKLATERGEQTELVAANIARKKEADAVLAQIEQARLDMEKRAEEVAGEQHAYGLELNARQQAVEKAEGELKAKVAEWTRVTSALRGA